MKRPDIIAALLLLLSLLSKLGLWFFIPKNAFFDWLFYDNLLYDMIFFGILIRSLRLVKARQWLINLAWMVLISCVVKDPLGNISDEFLSLTPLMYGLYYNFLTIPVLAFAICLFFVRRGPLRVYYRCLAIVLVLDILMPLWLGLIRYLPFSSWQPGLYIFILEYTILLCIVIKIAAVRRSEPLPFGE